MLRHFARQVTVVVMRAAQETMVSRTVATLFAEAKVKYLNEETEGIKKWNFVLEVNQLEITCHGLGTPFGYTPISGLFPALGKVGIVKKFSHHSTTEPPTITKEGIKLSREQRVYMSPSSYNAVYLKVNTLAKVRSSFCHAPLSLDAHRF